MKDRLEEIFELRESFMRSLSESLPDSSVTWPLDISKKESQQHCRDIALRGVEEMFEALQHLKNWKPHRITEVSEFNREEFIEEIVDAFNYFFSILILLDFDSSDFYNAYVKKDKIIHERLKRGY
tara:strand:+ start:695 stop:1069 length:375 start_codon:yes stop_codon:yes gene_type:complete